MNEHFDKPTGYVVCIDNSDYPASLERYKIYKVVPDEDAAADGDIRSSMRTVKTTSTLQVRSDPGTLRGKEIAGDGRVRECRTWRSSRPLNRCAASRRLSLVVRHTKVASSMNIWVDADACPAVIKEILYRVAKRAKIVTTFVANSFLQLPSSPYIEFRKVASGFDIADKTIGEELDAGDLVITADIPLASEVIDKGGHALNPRGEMYTTENIRGILNMRDFMDTLRGSGVNTGGPPPLGVSERKAFADSLDRFLAKNTRRT